MLLAVLALLFSNFALAQQSSSSDQPTVQQLVQQIQELQARVKTLEERQATQDEVRPSAANGIQVAVPPTSESTAETTKSHDLRGIVWRGFGELDYKALDQRTPELGTNGFVPGSAGGFYTGDLDLLLTSRITDKSGFLAELVVAEGDAQSFTVGLDRVLFKYDYNDYLRASFGRYHTGIGYYNQAFHSGKWLQTTADRPMIMEFADEGGILPTQAIGISLTGAIPSGVLGLNYILEYGSSDTIRAAIDGSGKLIDENNGNHINAGLFLRPGTIPGLQVGGSIYHDRISDFEKGPTVRLGQTIANAHVVYVSNGWEFLNEGFLVRHAYEQAPLVFDMPAFYSQVSRKIGHIRPFLRYQYINANPNSIFNDVRLRQGPSFGARYDFDDYVGLKVQLDRTLRTDKPDLNGIQTQLVFAF